MQPLDYRTYLNAIGFHRGFCGPWMGPKESPRRNGDPIHFQRLLFPSSEPPATPPAAIFLLALLHCAGTRTFWSLEAGARCIHEDAEHARRQTGYAIRRVGATSIEGKLLRRFRLALSYSSPVIP